MPRLHEREQMVREAELKISQAVNEATRDLTVGEQIRVVTAALGNFLGGIAKYMIRDERHGDTDKPGGLA